MTKLMKVLIGYDGSNCSDNVLADLRRAGLPREGAACIVTVADISQTAIPDKSDLDALGKLVSSQLLEETVTWTQRQTIQMYKQAQELAFQASRRVQSYLPEWQIAFRAAVGNPETKLLRKASDWKPNLIVVGSHGRSVVGRFFLGSVSKRVAAEAGCSVRIVHSGTEKDETSAPQIIVGVNNSLQAEGAIRAVARRVWMKGTQVRLISVDDGVSSRRISAVLPFAERMFERAREDLEAAGLEVSIDIKQGDIKTVLLSEAQNWDADAIFAPARGLKECSAEIKLDEVASSLATDADCTIEIVR